MIKIFNITTLSLLLIGCAAHSGFRTADFTSYGKNDAIQGAKDKSEETCKAEGKKAVLLKEPTYNYIEHNNRYQAIASFQCQ